MSAYATILQDEEQALSELTSAANRAQTQAARAAQASAAVAHVTTSALREVLTAEQLSALVSAARQKVASSGLEGEELEMAVFGEVLAAFVRLVARSADGLSRAAHDEAVAAAARVEQTAKLVARLRAVTETV